MPQQQLGICLHMCDIVIMVSHEALQWFVMCNCDGWTCWNMIFSLIYQWHKMTNYFPSSNRISDTWFFMHHVKWDVNRVLMQICVRIVWYTGHWRNIASWRNQELWKKNNYNASNLNFRESYKAGTIWSLLIYTRIHLNIPLKTQKRQTSGATDSACATVRHMKHQ